MDIGSLLGLIIAGAIIGALARFFMKGNQNMGMLWTIILGILGVLAGYFLSGMLGVSTTKGIDWIRWIISIVASMVFIGGYFAVRRKS